MSCPGEFTKLVIMESVNSSCAPDLNKTALLLPDKSISKTEIFVDYANES